MNTQTKFLTIYHDSFKITEAERVSQSACVIVNENVAVSGEIEKTSIKAGRNIVGSFEIKISEFEKSWTSLFLWMKENGYEQTA